MRGADGKARGHDWGRKGGGKEGGEGGGRGDGVDGDVVEEDGGAEGAD